MRLSTLTLSVCAASLLAACGHHKETIVERPGSTVVVTPQQAPAAGGTAASRSCVYNSATYSDGGLSCQAGHQYMCNAGTWQLTTGGC
jgi:hypothetical protein